MSKIVTRPLKAFLCHASGDKPAIREMYKRLVFEGVDAWLDKEKLLPGQDWRVEIPRAVQEADVVIVFLSKNSITKEGYVQKEIKDALDVAEEKPEGAIFLIPARLEECPVPERLSRWQWVDLFEDNGFIQLLRSLKLRARAVGATIEQVSYQESDSEVVRRAEQLYTEGLAAFYTEEWDKACRRFQTILSEYPNHKNAAEKLAEAEKQRSLARLYVRAEQDYKAENWQAAIQSLDELLERTPEYKDASQLRKNAKKQKRLGELYVEAKALHMAQKWHAVLKVFEQISAIEPACPDPDGLLPSAQTEVTELKRIADLNDQYSLAVRRMDAGEWLEARTLLEKVHKSQTSFMETERLLRKADDEIVKVEEQSRRTGQINVLYEQAHGLIRSKNWRKALDKIEEIQQLDSQFEDKDGITEQAKAELVREEQKIQRQNELAAMYAESVRLMQEGKYQEALDKWEEVRKIDPKYPDRQWVQRTARKKLAEMTKPVKVKPRLVIKKSFWIGLAAFAVVAAVIVGIVLLSQNGQPMSSEPTAGNIIATSPATSVPGTGAYADPTMYDDFDSTMYNDSYNKLLWEVAADSNNYVISQDKGKLTITVKDVGGAGLYSNKSSRIIKPTFFEMHAYLDPSTTDVDSHLYMGIETDQGDTVCGVFGYGNTESVRCWSNYYGKMTESSLGLDDISPGWHVFRIEIEPETMTISYVIDGRRAGSFVPRELIPEHYDDFKNKTFTFRLALNHTGSSKAPVGYIDYVRMGVIEDDPVLYDDFDSAESENGFDKSTWQMFTREEGNTARQNNGSMVLVSNGYENSILLLPLSYTDVKLATPTFIEASVRLSAGQNGGVGMQIATGSEYVYCHIWGMNNTQSIYCGSPSFTQEVETLKVIDISENTWHTIRVELDPVVPLFSFYIDGENAGKLAPKPVEKYKSAVYDFYLWSGCGGKGCIDQTSPRAVEGYYDYVKIGPLP